MDIASPGNSAGSRLLFIQIFAGYIIFRYLMRANFLLARISSAFHTGHDVGLERVALLDQLVHTLGIRRFDVG